MLLSVDKAFRNKDFTDKHKGAVTVSHHDPGGSPKGKMGSVRPHLPSSG